MTEFFKRFRNNPPLVLVVAFAIIILIGALLLTLPQMAKTNQATPFIDALFTATSAVCVTGLVTLTTARHWTFLGQLLIIILIQIGGLGFVTVTGSFFLFTDKKIDMKDRLIIAEEKNSSSLEGLVKLIRFIMIATFTIEGIGAILLSFRFIPEYGFKTGLWYSIFHSISAFCNAGFDIIGDVSLSNLNGSPLVIITVGLLIILGGLGFPVYQDMINTRRWKKLKLYSKMAISMTLFLVFFGMVVIFLLERNNSETLENQAAIGKLLGSFFQSVTCRTAGYYSISQANLREATVFFCCILMFIGGSPAGTAGGIKTTTFAIWFLSTRSQIRKQEDINIFDRRISKESTRKAMAVIFVATAWISISVFFLSITEEGVPFLDLLFEEISAFATVGLTRGITPALSFPGKLIIIFSMYLGKVGPLTVAYLITNKVVPKYREAYGEILVG